MTVNGNAKVISKHSYGSLSGKFRLSSREYGAVNYMRRRMGMNMSHIAEVLGRSPASVHRVLRIGNALNIDNRGQTRTTSNNRRYNHLMNRRTLRIRIRMWFHGIVDTLQEALEVRNIPLPLLKKLNESSDSEEDEDPA